MGVYDYIHPNLSGATLSLDTIDYPYKEITYIPKKIRTKTVFGFCLNKHCDFKKTNDKKCIECPRCRHSLFWSNREIYKK